MKRSELHNDLQQEYSSERGFGVTRVEDPQFQNMWFVIPPAPPEIRPSNLPLDSLAQAHQVVARQISIKEATDLDKVTAYLLLSREAISSSRMEGTWSTIDHVLTPGEDLIDSEVKEATASIRGYSRGLIEFYEKFAEKGISSFTRETICQLHNNIMARDSRFSHFAGKIRSPQLEGSVVQIGGFGRTEDSLYNPTPPQYVANKLEETLKWFRNDILVTMGDAGNGLTLPIRLAIGHSHFEAVHPFRDGNGRVGRMIWPLQMVCTGVTPLYLSGYVEKEKREYSLALQAAQKQLDYAPLVEFICSAIIASDADAYATRNYLVSLSEKWKVRTTSRKNSAAQKTLETLLAQPIFTINELKERLSISFESASKAAKKLQEDKIIRERTGFGRNRVFAAEEVIYALSREFGQPIELAEERARKLLGY